MTKLQLAAEIEAPVEKVYGFFLDADNWAAVFPGDIQVKRNYSGNPKVGDTFDLTAKVGGRRMRASVKFTDLLPNARIVREQLDGDMKSFSDTIVFEKTEAGTCVTETWEYEPPYSFVGRILDAVKVRKDLKSYLTRGHIKAKERLEASDL